MNEDRAAKWVRTKLIFFVEPRQGFGSALNLGWVYSSEVPTSYKPNPNSTSLPIAVCICRRRKRIFRAKMCFRCLEIQAQLAKRRLSSKPSRRRASLLLKRHDPSNSCRRNRRIRSDSEGDTSASSVHRVRKTPAL